MPPTSKIGGGPSQRQERRRASREYAKSLVYVELGDNNGGIALNFSETGIAVQAANAVSEEIIPAIRFQLPHSHLWIQTSGRVVWTSESQTLLAIEFVGLSEKSLEQIRQWLDYESKIDINSGLAPASSDLPVGPRTSPKVASALASMLSHDPHFTKMEEQLLEQSEVSTYSEPVAPVRATPAKPAAPAQPVAEVHVEPAAPEPPPKPAETPLQAVPKHILAEREKPKMYEPPARVFPGSAAARHQEQWQPERRKEITPAIPIDPEVEQAQEEIRQIIASGDEALSRKILGRLQKSPAKRHADKPRNAMSDAAQSVLQAAPAQDGSKPVPRARESALNRTAVRIELQKPERQPYREAISAPSSRPSSWALPLLLGILVALLAVLLWLGTRGALAGLFGSGVNPSAQKVASTERTSPVELKDLQIEVVDAKGRHRTIPAVPAPANRPLQKPASQPQ